MANLGWEEIKLPNPVFLGDTVYCETEILTRRESKSHPEAGIVRFRSRGINQDGAVVLDYTRSAMIYKRTPRPGYRFRNRTSADPAAVKPLAGLRLIDLSTVLAGPYSASLLADLGADVIKVEPPAGDTARALVTEEGLAPHFLTNQRNKRGIVIDLSIPPAGRLRRPGALGDVVLENYRPGVTGRLGIDYPALAALNPRIIMCSITGYGLTGPGRDRAAFDANIQAYAGIMGLTGEPDGMPLRPAPAYADLCAGMAGALGILAAVAARERTGRGQHIDLAMLDVQLSMQNYYCTMEFGLGPGRRGGWATSMSCTCPTTPTAPPADRCV